MKQTVVEASWDAWIKYYRQDENSPNALVSYYLKGSLIALCLDLLIRNRTRGRKSLDDVMLALWQRHGQTGAGVPETGVEQLAEEIAGTRLRSFFDKALRSTDELPLKQWLATVGLEMQLRPAESASDKGGKPSKKPPRELAARVTLGARTAEDTTGVRLTHVLDGGAAQAAGLSAADVLIAIGGLRTNARNLDKRLAQYKPGERVAVHGFRRDELFERTVVLQGAPTDTCSLAVSGTDAASRRRREHWLGKE
jgi:predicted metalloprotease with PDZ domain